MFKKDETIFFFIIFTKNYISDIIIIVYKVVGCIMKIKIKKIIFLALLIVLFIPKNYIKAQEITIDNVISYFNSNNLFDEPEYFDLFGRVLNGEDEYEITDYEVTAEKKDNEIIINSILEDSKEGKIEKETKLSIEENTISYTNNNDVKSLESRIDTILFIQLMYSIGGARGYNKEVLVNWMNQIDLDNLNEEKGIKCESEKVKLSFKVNDDNYNYVLNIPKNYTININELTDSIPLADYVQIKEVKKGTSSITVSIYAEGHENEQCEIYRQKDNKYERIATVSCNNGEYTDEDLKDDTEYTYQATIKDKIVCSDTKKIRTDEIPLTGTHIYISILFSLIIIGTALFLVSKKYNLFKKV